MNLETYKKESLTEEEFAHIEGIYKSEFVKFVLILIGGTIGMAALAVVSLLSDRENVNPAVEITKTLMFLAILVGLWFFILYKSGNRYLNFKNGKYNITRTALLNKKTVTFNDNKKNNDINYGITTSGPVSFASEKDYLESVIGFEIILIGIMLPNKILKNAFYVPETTRCYRQDGEEMTAEEQAAIEKADADLGQKEAAGEQIGKKKLAGIGKN